MFCSLAILVIEARVSSCLSVVPKIHCLGVVPKPRHGKEFLVVHLRGPKAPLVTSWTKDNPGKRFNGYGLYKVTGMKWCNYFEWHNSVANSRQKRIIVALMKKVDELNLREKDLQTKINDMKMKGKFLGNE
ncbi:hypothetical protein GmHk_12G033731 [Glycine max]|nr:hypothetical protein GmHk_12G033731 [Glycine max]